MKRRSTTPVSKGLVTRSALVASAILMVAAAPLAIQKSVYADVYDDQINALQNEINQYDAQAGQLSNQANTLQSEINGIERQKAIIQGQIDLSQAKYNKLQEEIAQTQQQIQNNQDALGQTLADLYVDSKVTPLEMLASSHNISDYLDKETYRSTIQTQLTSTITQIQSLKASLIQQQTDVQRTLADQANSKNALVAQENAQSTLLAQTQGQESAYQALSASRETQKLQVQQQQQAAIEAAIAAAAGGHGVGVVLPGTTAYPWNASNCYMDSNAMSYGGVDGNGGDGMGYGCRQCVSYVAWRVYKETNYAPINWGNAYDWPTSARNAGYQVSTVPRAHAAGVIMSGGEPGHIVWVESVDESAGTMIVSQYNYYNAGGPGWGNYSKMQVPIGTYQEYIYF